MTLHDIARIDVGGNSGFRGQSTGLVHGGIDILPLAGHVPITHRRHDGDIRKMTTDVPGIAATGSDRRCIGDILRVVAAAPHLPARRQLQQIRGLIIAPRPGLPKGRQRAHDEPGVQARQRLIPQSQARQIPRGLGFQEDIGRRYEAAEKVFALDVSEIERNPPLGGVVVPERQARVPRCGISCRNGPTVRVCWPPGGSILMTSAPKSAINLPQNWPFSSANSSTLSPVSGPGRRPAASRHR